jgi:hypothetical protein
MITEKIFEHEVALQQLVALEDVLRRQLRRSMKFQNDWQEGEVGMALDCLDEIAKYLRENQNNMTRDEIKDLYDVLLRFERRYNRWDEGKYCVSFEKIDIEPLLKKSLDDYNERHKKE